ERLVERNQEQNGEWHFLAVDLPAVHQQDTRSTLAETSAVFSLEVEHDGVLARAKDVGAFPAEAFRGELDVRENRLALDQIEAIDDEVDNKRNDDCLGDRVRDLRLRA